MDEINGVSLETLADVMSKEKKLQEQLGERYAKEELVAFLASRGLTEEEYRAAYKAWWQRFRADPTGMLQARLEELVSELTPSVRVWDGTETEHDTLPPGPPDEPLPASMPAVHYVPLPRPPSMLPRLFFLALPIVVIALAISFVKKHAHPGGAADRAESSHAATETP